MECSGRQLENLWTLMRRRRGGGDQEISREDLKPFGLAGKRLSRRGLRLGTAGLPHQFFTHQAMQQVDRLQGTHHHLEMDDAALLVERDDVDAVELDAFDL